MQLFFNPDITEKSSHFTFPSDESRHIVKVLRKREGDTLHITNGKGFLFEATIIATDIRKCSVTIVKSTFHPNKNSNLHIAVAPTKMNDRYEWFLEKATEIGITEITPIICDHSERKVIKKDRMQKVLQSAMKQSLQFHLPKLNNPISAKDFIKNNNQAKNNNQQYFIAHCEETEKVDLKERLIKNSNVTILIGPEGDFSTSEIEIALATDYKPVSLGENRLRTETAAIFACATVNLLN
ncbi:16S rRNA (uracil(1498)-N(3))-methyltransferase [Cellulophaga baltica]|uniref:16S rRNA (uracil(1498)-N(3))-methyltransferase n=1 Tax=Cellulophaga TaxID=104264 RepID=UPI001C06A4FB|nr:MULTISPECIES: 16S rRNA (uracil(1498)-N(3))-methyltransferase [Cellulophaga]MBU2996710.1 16S rRNA (uracil(1498)-N(3))-methyltransferase [Cellulophaga baltica]MDO6768104.1 16S rRNA (uracil(1498)-N(3))-methyltransferase [Cellulophaga sp. 1_MG-2023]